jgi:hypothetical protein
VRFASTLRGDGSLSSTCSTFATVASSAPIKMLLGERSSAVVVVSEEAS